MIFDPLFLPDSRELNGKNCSAQVVVTHPKMLRVVEAVKVDQTRVRLAIKERFGLEWKKPEERPTK